MILLFKINSIIFREKFKRIWSYFLFLRANEKETKLKNTNSSQKKIKTYEHNRKRGKNNKEREKYLNKKISVCNSGGIFLFSLFYERMNRGIHSFCDAASFKCWMSHFYSLIIIVKRLYSHSFSSSSSFVVVVVVVVVWPVFLSLSCVYMMMLQQQ